MVRVRPSLHTTIKSTSRTTIKGTSRGPRARRIEASIIAGECARAGLTCRSLSKGQITQQICFVRLAFFVQQFVQPYPFCQAAGTEHARALWPLPTSSAAGRPGAGARADEARAEAG